MTSSAGPQPAESLEQATAGTGTTNRWVHTQCTSKLKPVPVLELRIEKGQMKKKNVCNWQIRQLVWYVAINSE